MDMEDINDFRAANSAPDDLFDYLKLNGLLWNKEKKLYLFIDEVHLLDNPAKLVKSIVDHYKDIKLFVTGSSSTEIRKKFTDSLPGRKQEFLLTTLSFSEYLKFNNEKALSNLLIKNIEELFKMKIPSPNVI